jgi:hypothetical protein
MAICSCGLPARCCQPAVAGGFTYADLRSEIHTHLAPAGFVYSEFSCVPAAATSFPLSKHTGGGDTAPAFSGLRVYLQFTWEMGFPPSLVEFSSHCRFYKLSHSWLLGGAAAPASWRVCLQLTWEVGLLLSPVEFSSLHHSHKLSHSWLMGVCPRSCWSLSAQARLAYLQFWEGFPSPPLELRVPHPLCYVSLLFLLLITHFLFFPRWGGGLSRGLCLPGPGLSVEVPCTT